MADIKTRDFSAASAVSILDPQLRKALAQVGTGFDAARRAAIDEVSPELWDEWREEARQIKVHALDHLDYYLDLLEQNVAKAGGHVHFAKDAAQANEIMGELVRTRNIKVATKSKSMVSEELSLNPALEAQGVDVYETDLGEYIIQLAEETPFHLVAPALHKTKEQVAQLFTDKLGIPYTEDINGLAAAARIALREKFLEADLGISGANFLVAETGTLVIITNEGNGRLSTSAPRIHVGITGMEKSDSLHAGPGRLPPVAAPVGHRSGNHQLREHGHRPPALRRRRRPGGVPPNNRGQRPVQDAGRPGLKGSPLLHPLCRLPEHLPRVPEGRRPCLRLGLSGADRGDCHAISDRAKRSARPASSVKSLRSLQRSLPGENQPSPHVVAPAAEERRKPGLQRKIGGSGSQPSGRRLHPVDAEPRPIKVVSRMGTVETKCLGRHALIPLNKEERNDS